MPRVRARLLRRLHAPHRVRLRAAAGAFHQHTPDAHTPDARTQSRHVSLSRARASMRSPASVCLARSPVASQEDFFTEGVAYEAAMATLIEAIAADVEFGKSQLETPEMLAFRSDPFLAS